MIWIRLTKAEVMLFRCTTSCSLSAMYRLHYVLSRFSVGIIPLIVIFTSHRALYAIVQISHFLSDEFAIWIKGLTSYSPSCVRVNAMQAKRVSSGRYCIRYIRYRSLRSLRPTSTLLSQGFRLAHFRHCMCWGVVVIQRFANVSQDALRYPEAECRRT